MFRQLLTVCEGNLCRSPLAKVLLANALPECQVGSAGLHAVTGADMDATAREVAAEKGTTCPPHQARQLDAALVAAADLLLVMEQRQRERIMARFPGGSGKVFLLRHWLDGADIPDPYQRDRDTHAHVYRMIAEGVASWLPRLA